MKTAIRNSKIVGLGGLVLAAALSLPAQAEKMSPELTASIRENGQAALQGIRAQARQDLLEQASTLDVPGVEMGPTEVIETEVAGSGTDSRSALDAAVQERVDLWVKTLLASGEQDLYRALSMARMIVLDTRLD